MHSEERRWKKNKCSVPLFVLSPRFVRRFFWELFLEKDKIRVRCLKLHWSLLIPRGARYFSRLFSLSPRGIFVWAVPKNNSVLVCEFKLTTGNTISIRKKRIKNKLLEGNMKTRKKQLLFFGSERERKKMIFPNWPS